MNGPQIVCCACGAAPTVILAPPLCADCEARAAQLWQRDNPKAGPFQCSDADKTAYRQRVAASPTR